MPVGADPLPHGVLVKTSIESAIHINPAIWIGEEHWTGNGRGMMRGRGACPARSLAIPKPGIAQIPPVVTAEEHDFLDDGVVSHLTGSARRRRKRGLHAWPTRPVECPGVVKMSGAIKSTEHDYFSAGRIVSHRQIRARWRRDIRRKLNPGFGATSGSDSTGGCQQRHAKAGTNEKTKMPRLILSHQTKLTC